VDSYSTSLHSNNSEVRFAVGNLCSGSVTWMDFYIPAWVRSCAENYIKTPEAGSGVYFQKIDRIKYNNNYIIESKFCRKVNLETCISYWHGHSLLLVHPVLGIEWKLGANGMKLLQGNRSNLQGSEASKYP